MELIELSSFTSKIDTIVTEGEFADLQLELLKYPVFIHVFSKKDKENFSETEKKDIASLIK